MPSRRPLRMFPHHRHLRQISQYPRMRQGKRGSSGESANSRRTPRAGDVPASAFRKGRNGRISDGRETRGGEGKIRSVCVSVGRPTTWFAIDAPRALPRHIVTETPTPWTTHLLSGIRTLNAPIADYITAGMEDHACGLSPGGRRRLARNPSSRRGAGRRKKGRPDESPASLRTFYFANAAPMPASSCASSARPRTPIPRRRTSRCR